MPSFSTFRRILQQVDAQGWVDSFNVWVLTHAPDLAGQLLSLPSAHAKRAGWQRQQLHWRDA
ncbi:MAG: hypothetical protein KME10_00225 [Plectolyngbya sp. WJT66-NPBG17]|nr:hypothetical protein [Plectolyngbya sp. WJT66-NPBG17]MBW4523604.1 hypothetical protein [Phormidium tanganyikae FI6-MK23]MBW4528118.1 hypothetical protein [Phormidium tanganyikae FI6-MK23]